MKYGRYVGDLEHLEGEGAIIMDHSEDDLLAQFDNREAYRDGVCLAYGWHRFAKQDFEEMGV